MSLKRVQDVSVDDIYKRKKPKNHYVSYLQELWNDKLTIRKRSVHECRFFIKIMVSLTEKKRKEISWVFKLHPLSASFLFFRVNEPVILKGKNLLSCTWAWLYSANKWTNSFKMVWTRYISEGYSRNIFVSSSVIFGNFRKMTCG